MTQNWYVIKITLYRTIQFVYYFKSSMVQQKSLVEDKKIGMTIFGQFFIRYLI